MEVPVCVHSPRLDQSPERAILSEGDSSHFKIYMSTGRRDRTKHASITASPKLGTSVIELFLKNLACPIQINKSEVLPNLAWPIQMSKSEVLQTKGLISVNPHHVKYYRPEKVTHCTSKDSFCSPCQLPEMYLQLIQCYDTNPSQHS